MRKSDGRADFAEVDRVFLVVNSVLVGSVLDRSALISAAAVLAGYVVYGEDTVLRACFDRHIGNAESVVHVQLRNAFARELHRLVESAVNTDHADDVENNVLAADIALGLADEIELDRGRNLEPCLAADHACRHVG